ncbi:MAG: helix-turn-helix transcriptional regulator [bacterium]|nr:helix-turn-helix transcriptional regulator [bacterium]
MNQQLLKGHSELLILAALNKRPMHGYALSEYLKDEMAEMFKFGVGMLYPLLHKLEKDKYIAGYWEESGGLRKRVYQLTKQGKKELNTKRQEWNNLSLLVQNIINHSMI